MVDRQSLQYRNKMRPTQDQIEKAIQESGIVRFRQLADPNHPDFNPAYDAMIIQTATNGLKKGNINSNDDNEVRTCQPSQEDYKNILQRIATAGLSAMKAGANFVASGGQFVTEEQYKERIDICNSCEHKIIKILNQPQCAKCSCFIEAKTRLPREFCPLLKWKAL